MEKMFGEDFGKLKNTLEKDHTQNKEEALLDFYRKMRPTEPASGVPRQPRRASDRDARYPFRSLQQERRRPPTLQRR